MAKAWACDSASFTAMLREPSGPAKTKILPRTLTTTSLSHGWSSNVSGSVSAKASTLSRTRATLDDDTAPPHAYPGPARLRSRTRRRDRAAAGAGEPRDRARRRHDDLRQPDAREDDGERAPRP